MQDLHDSNLLHRDIKPANIMVTSSRGEEKAYLTDFGIARDAADTLGLTATTQAVLTLAYAAPERLSLPSGAARSPGRCVLARVRVATRCSPAAEPSPAAIRARSCTS